jgi:hypothetical protein
MTDEPLPNSELILYQTEDGRTRVQCRFENDTLWLTQAQMAELFETTPQNITLHLKAIFAEGELDETATCKDYLQVRLEGAREVSRRLRHYRLEVILAVGFRVRSHRGTQFRQWATARLSEYLVKGFTMDDERLKNPPGKGQRDYFDELLERIRGVAAAPRRGTGMQDSRGDAEYAENRRCKDASSRSLHTSASPRLRVRQSRAVAIPGHTPVLALVGRGLRRRQKVEPNEEAQRTREK